MISGFVICISVEEKENLKSFIASRFIRLYPMLWMCVSITFLNLFFLGVMKGHKDLPVTLYSYFANMTMLPRLFNSNIVDASYWTLMLEFKFYLFMGIILFLKIFKKLKYVIYLLIAFSYFNTFIYDLHFTASMQWSSYFISGILFYFIYKKQDTKINFLLILVNMLTGIKWALSRVEDVNPVYEHNPFYVIVILILFNVIFALVSLNKLSFHNTKIITILGSLTYPVYLLHQEIGYVWFKYLLENKILDKNIILIISIFIIFIISFLLTKYLEKPIQKLLRDRLDNLL